MSWDIYLYDDRGHHEGSWNYTHNVNPMTRAALERIGSDFDWWQDWEDLPGPEGAKVAWSIATELDSDPARYDEMNPPNGWGSREGLVPVLREMAQSVPEWPCTWSVWG